MPQPNRISLKAQAKERVLDPSYGVLIVTFFYLLLTDWLSELLGLAMPNPISAVIDRLSESAANLMQNTASSAASAIDLSPAYSAALLYARELLAQPGQRAALFVFLLFQFYSIVIAFGFRRYALRVSRGERLGVRNLMDSLWMAGRIILLQVLVMVLSALGGMFFLLPGVFLYYTFLLAPYVLIDCPDLTALQTLRACFGLMRGRRMQLFMLDVSFIGWMIVEYMVMLIGVNVGNLLGSDLLSSILWLLGYTVIAVYLVPYRELSYANFYNMIRPEDLPLS